MNDVAMLMADPGLDRAAALRANPDTLAALVADANACFLLLEDGDPIVRKSTENVPASLWFPRSVFEDLTPGCVGVEPMFLGLDRATGTGRFALVLQGGGVGRETARERLQAQAGSIEPRAGLRTLLSTGALPTTELSAAALARSLSGWHSATAFCGWCGGRTGIVDGGWRRRCGGCGRESYPRVDPVVIMLVTDGQRCVLAHEPRFPERMYSCIAGYVDPGEDIAHAVRRETDEEIGLAIGEVVITGSQPWPFPHTLMIGCIAKTAGGELKIDPTEIEDARWFTREEVRQMLARSHPDGLWEPGPQAIAHHLISTFARG